MSEKIRARLERGHFQSGPMVSAGPGGGGTAPMQVTAMVRAA